MSRPVSHDGSTDTPSSCVQFQGDDKARAQQKAQHLEGTSPDLAELIELWPTLPKDVKAQILRLANQAWAETQ